MRVADWNGHQLMVAIASICFLGALVLGGYTAWEISQQASLAAMNGLVEAESERYRLFRARGDASAMLASVIEMGRLNNRYEEMVFTHVRQRATARPVAIGFVIGVVPAAVLLLAWIWAASRRRVGRQQRHESRSFSLTVTEKPWVLRSR